MKPHSKVIQIIIDNPNYQEKSYIALCEDGSIWYFFPTITEGSQWELINEIDEGRYTR